MLDPDETNTLAAIPTLESLDDQARAPVPLRDFAKNQKRRAWMKLTPAQRLAWLEEAKRFAELVKRSRQVTEEECQTEH